MMTMLSLRINRNFSPKINGKGGGVVENTQNSLTAKDVYTVRNRDKAKSASSVYKVHMYKVKNCSNQTDSLATDAQKGLSCTCTSSVAADRQI